MKYIKILLLAFISIPVLAQQPIDVYQYRYAIELNNLNDTIKGEATISFLRKNRQSPVSFDLAGLKNGLGMKISSVTLLPGRSAAAFTHENERLTIPASTFAAMGDSISIIINYQGIPADGLIISKNKFGKRTFFSDNWPNRAHNWIPCVDDPADKSAVEFIIIAPGHYQVISNGIQVEETNLAGNRKMTHYRETVPLPTKVMVIGVAEFAVSHAGFASCVPVSSWVYPENKTAGFHDYAQARDVLEFFTGYIAPYPYLKLANVQSKTMFGGMENAGAIFYFENSVTGKREEEPLLAHEIVHQWFGNMATEKSFSHLWLSEGFATYLTHLYMQSRYGDAIFRQRLIADRSKILSFVNLNPLPVVDSSSALMELLNANSYEKGSWVLHMLREQTGDSAFRRIIQTYYDRFRGRNAETADFMKIAEEVTGKNLGNFFLQWLFTPENPDLAITWKYDAAKKSVILNVKQQTKNVFQFPLDIRFKFRSGTINKEILVDRQQQEFSILVDESPVELIADPGVRLLFQGTMNNRRIQ